MNAEVKIHEKVDPKAKEGAKILALLRALGSEDQRIAYAVMEGMKLQKAISQQGQI